MYQQRCWDVYETRIQLKVIFYSCGDIPVFATLVAWGGFLKNGAMDAVWIEFAQKNCQSSEIGKTGNKWIEFFLWYGQLTKGV